ncbi:hypothetical protein CL622_08520 [archaeon]|nr:hypothetical protein [archaeon]
MVKKKTGTVNIGPNVRIGRNVHIEGKEAYPVKVVGDGQELNYNESAQQAIQERLGELEAKMTTFDSGFSEQRRIVTGAKAVFDAFYTRYGLKGVENLYQHGYDDGQRLLNLYKENNRAVERMAESIELI